LKILVDKKRRRRENFDIFVIKNGISKGKTSTAGAYF